MQSARVLLVAAVGDHLHGRSSCCAVYYLTAELSQVFVCWEGKVHFVASVYELHFFYWE